MLVSPTHGIPAPDDVDIREDLDAFVGVVAEVFGGPEPIEHAEACRRQDAASDRYRRFVAFVQGRPVGAASYVRMRDAAYLASACVVESARGRGIYRALLGARLASIAADGLPTAITHARETTSAPILERLGFQTRFRYRMYGDAR